MGRLEIAPRYLTDEHDFLRREVRNFAEKECKPIAAEIDASKRFPAENFKKMGQLGFHGVLIPEKYGGSEMGAVACCIVNEELARVCASTALSYLAHSVLCVNNLYLHGSEAQREKFLPKLCNGEHLGAWALTEPGSGSDAKALKTRAEKKGDTYILNGSKTFITNAFHADVIIVFARIGSGEDKSRGLTAFIVEKGAAGLHVEEPMTKMGMRASPTSGITLDNCEVPAENLLGSEGGASQHMMKGLDIERATIAAISVGIAQGALDVAIEYSTQRKQFGQEIGKFQMIKKFLADMATETRAARLLTYDAAARIDDGEEDLTMDASMAKMYASEVGTRVAMNAVQVLGGYGYISEFPVERMARDAKLLEIGAGTSEIQRLMIARELFKQAGHSKLGGSKS